nr:hypothetical protein [Escherichia coli]
MMPLRKSTIVISDPTLADKFVGSSTESVGRHEVNVIKRIGHAKIMVRNLFMMSLINQV